jgi:hypothetical protein
VKLTTLQRLFVILTACACGVVLYAQNPISIAQVGTTAVGSTVPVSGTVTANMGTVTADPFGANADAASASGSISAKLRFIATTGIPVTGTVAVTQSGAWSLSANQSTNVAQFGGTNVVTGTGASGAGIPRVTISNDSSLAANQSVNVAQMNGVATTMNNGTAGTGVQRVAIASDNTAIANWGMGATGSAVPSGAQYIGGNAATSLPTAATAGNLVGPMFDKYGRLVTVSGTIRDLVGTQTTTLSATTSETTIVTAAASVFNDLVMLIVSNTSAATNTRIDIRDTTGGSVLFSLYSVGGSPPTGFALPVPVPQTSVNTNWTAQCATSTTDVRIYAVFQKNR